MLPNFADNLVHKLPCRSKWVSLTVYIRMIIYGSVKDCSISSANALDILQSCTKPSTCVSSVTRIIHFQHQSWRLFRLIPCHVLWDSLMQYHPRNFPAYLMTMTKPVTTSVTSNTWPFSSSLFLMILELIIFYLSWKLHKIATPIICCGLLMEEVFLSNHRNVVSTRSWYLTTNSAKSHVAVCAPPSAVMFIFKFSSYPG